ncbi:MAG TPA: carboxypeptidase regulatory-like domain-containing protein, partial [Blastocatellia bacterium]|nr:carboxypeptidase regulatory-like domain-containing protein [Blastocatellia bacterium]
TQYEQGPVLTDETGSFRLTNIPQNGYTLTISAKGFGTATQTVDVRSNVPINLGKIALAPAGSSNIVEVRPPTVEDEPTTHVDYDRNVMDKLPTSSPGAGFNDLIQSLSPSVAADSNGFFHPLGDHAQTSYSIDDQPISDQRSKAFSTQLPVDAIQSISIITGNVPAEFGDKTSLVVDVVTRSGLGETQPHGSFSGSYGTFGTTDEQGTLGIGGKQFGNFTAFDFTRSGRFFDPPEFTVLHDRGLSAGLFDRLDYNPGSVDALHLNIFLSRNNFQIPNQFDQEAIGQDQHQLVRSIDLAGGWVHTFNQYTLLTINPYYRMDQVWYYPSPNPFDDQTQTISQQRRLINAGVKSDVAYTKGRHNIKVGIQASHTFLTEAFQFGITDPNFNVPGTPTFLPGLEQFDLTRGGHEFLFNGHTDIKQEAFFAMDSITVQQLTLSLGFRFDNYNGIVRDNAPEPRIGGSYLIKRTNTVLRGSYGRMFETPYNENLILSSTTGAGGLAANGVLDTSSSDQPLKPGRRNMYDAGFQQGFGKYLVLDADYFWKFTDNAYDFNVILNTPITFPISWAKSKLDGFGLRASLNNYHGLSIIFNAGHTRARYFPPETGGLFFNSGLPAGAFRIDHDQAFQQTTNVLYTFNQIKSMKPFIEFTWQYESGLVAGSVPDFATALTLTPDQQAQIGLFCGDTFATPTQGITSCSSPVFGATRVVIPKGETENDDTNPPRVAPRHLFNASVGTDNLLHGEHTRVSLRFSVINLTDKDALYNFLSTFSGTHFVTPRTVTAQIGLHF